MTPEKSQFDPHEFGAGAEGLTPDQLAANAEVASQLGEAQMAEQQRLINANERASGVGDFAARLALHVEDIEVVVPPVDQSPNTTGIHDSIHDEEQLTRKTLSELDKRFRPPQSGLVA